MLMLQINGYCTYLLNVKERQNLKVSSKKCSYESSTKLLYALLCSVDTRLSWEGSGHSQKSEAKKAALNSKLECLVQHSLAKPSEHDFGTVTHCRSRWLLATNQR